MVENKRKVGSMERGGGLVPVWLALGLPKGFLFANTTILLIIISALSFLRLVNVPAHLKQQTKKPMTGMKTASRIPTPAMAMIPA